MTKGKARMVWTGNWKNGVKSGEFNDYDDKGKVKQVSVYENGRMSRVKLQFSGSTMTEYDRNGKAYVGKFRGDTERGFERCGKGREYGNGGKWPVYSGNRKDGRRDGMGIELDGIIPTYWGKWSNNRRNGKYNGVVWLWLGIVAVIIVIIVACYLNAIRRAFTSCSQFEEYSRNPNEKKTRLVFKKGCDCKRIVIGDGCVVVTRNWNDVPKDTINDGTFRIVNCPKLRTIQIGDYSFGDYHSFTLENLPSLYFLHMG